MTEQSTRAASDDAQVRRLRRTELLMQRERAAALRRRRGFGLRPPTSQPLIFSGSGRSRMT
jgi:hypothetical protein